MFNKTGTKSGNMCKPGIHASFLAALASVPQTFYAVSPLNGPFDCQHVM